ncbi:hypothetical protein [Streptomyces griseoluteus]
MAPAPREQRQSSRVLMMCAAPGHLASADGSYITGGTIHVDGGFTA